MCRFTLIIPLLCVILFINSIVKATTEQDKELFEAAKIGDDNSIKSLLENGANITAEDTDKETALHYAVIDRDAITVRLLIKNGARIYAKNKDGKTPIDLAVERNYTTIERFLREDRPDKLAEENMIEYQLLKAAEQGNLEKVKILIENGAYVNITSYKYKQTPLHKAAANGNTEVVKVLIENGGDINAMNMYNDTPLHRAVRNGHPDIVKILVENKANLNPENDYKETPLHWAVINGNINMMKTLLENGVNVNVENIDKTTPLHVAVTFGKEEIAKLLVKSGARTLTKNKMGKTALNLATEKDFPSLVKFLSEQRPAKQACQAYKFDLSSRILGGELAATGEFPWMAALGYFDIFSDKLTYDCGGTIISDLFIITAAHCAKERRQPVKIRLGKLSLTDENIIRANNRRVKDIIRHPNYSALTAHNDIALIKVIEPIIFGYDIKPACLQISPDDLASDVNLIVTGWGRTSSEGFGRSDDLLKTQLKTVPMSECNATFLEISKTIHLAAYRNGLTNGQYCAHDPQMRNDSCQGDSGGPLQYFESDSSTAHILGIVSYGVACGSQYPSVYTRVAHYLDWIESVVWPTS